MPSYTVDKFLKDLPGSQNQLIDIISQIDATGDWKVIQGIDTIIKHILVALLIPKRSYIFNPTYGCGIYKYLFEPADMTTYELLNDEVSDVISGINISLGVNVTHDILFYRNKKGFQINITVEHDKKQKTVTLDIDESLLKVVV